MAIRRSRKTHDSTGLVLCCEGFLGSKQDTGGQNQDQEDDMRIRQFVSWAVALVCLVVVSVNAQADPIVVNCDQGQSLNRTLARMNKATPATVLVKGTCIEYVRVSGFDGLT